MRNPLTMLGTAVVAVLAMTFVEPVIAADNQALDRDARAALKTLYDKTPAAKALGAQAKGILVFPKIVKAGFVVGGQGGDGVLLTNGKTAGYFSTAGLSVGFQAGAQTFGYALFFMTDSALQYVKDTNGWEIGVGPSVVIVDSGMARNLTTTTAKSDVYAFVFHQQGLMAGAGLQGTKISKMER
jgi:lipid-binding SYLF domain-containing protein